MALFGEFEALCIRRDFGSDFIAGRDNCLCQSPEWSVPKMKNMQKWNEMIAGKQAMV